MHRKHLPAMLLLALALLSATAGADSIDLTVEFSQDDLSFAVRDGYDQVYMGELDLLSQPGRPQLPVMVTRAIIPPGHAVQAVKTIETDLVDLPGRYDIYPAQPPQILSLAARDPGRMAFAQPEDLIYRSRQPYPAEAVQVTGHGYLAGYHLVDLEICPLIYLPAERRLRFIRRLRFRILTAPGGRQARPVGGRSLRERTFYEEMVGPLVLNPEDTHRMAPAATSVSSKSLAPGEYEYVIITGSDYVDEFQPLADWKGQKGVPDTIVTRSWIEANYSGYDVREEIRNFIIDAYGSWGTRWVLLGGDTNVIPSRIGFAMACEAGYHPADEDSIRADLYFSDLDGDWDADGDHIYGEVADSVDLYADVFVGRASVSSQSEATAWVNKVLLYERTPQPDQALKMLFAAEELWAWPTYTDGGVHKDMIDDQSIPPRFDPIKKLYESQGNENADSVRYYINQGQNLINHDGHCWYDVMSMGSGTFSPTDMDNLINADEPAILYSIGCWPAAFDYDCMAEHWTNNPNGGGVAFVGNSRYGWGSPGNPGYGYSDIYDSRFFHELFVNGQFHIGATLAAAKAHYVPKSRMANVYRIHQYEVNLLGDPEMPIWTDTPGALTVTHPDHIPVGLTHVEVTVTDGGDPVAGARVSVQAANGLCWRGTTGLNGQVNPQLTVPAADSAIITVTAQNYYPHQEAVDVLTAGPFVVRSGETIDDAGGNGNGELNPGETVDLTVVLQNSGTQTVFGVSAILRSSDELAAVLDSTGTYGDLSPGDTAGSSYQVSFSPDAQNGQVFHLTLEIQDDSSNVWSSVLGLMTVAPSIAFGGAVVDAGGDGIPQPGETIDVEAILTNAGLGMAARVTAQLTALDEYAAVTVDTAAYGDIPADSSFGPITPFQLAVADSCPAHHDLPLRLDIVAVGGYSFTEGLILAIGDRGFDDDMESGVGGWTHGGTKDHWHLSAQRSHSGATSWYCGLADSLVYEKNTDAYLLSPPVVLGPNSTLTFWSWYDVPIYGSDGLYVVVGWGAQWDTLNYFGTGGALDQLYMGNDWLPDEHDLSGYDTVQVKFIFHSDWDADVAEGFYLDDVTVTGAFLAGGDVLPPGAVANLTLTLTADTALVLAWSPVADDDLDHYVVYRDTLFDFQPDAANSLAATGDTTYVDDDAGIVADTVRSYYYLVRAVDGSGKKSEPSQAVGEFDRTLQTGE
jgi:hypothetical protein